MSLYFQCILRGVTYIALLVDDLACKYRPIRHVEQGEEHGARGERHKQVETIGQ